MSTTKSSDLPLRSGIGLVPRCLSAFTIAVGLCVLTFLYRRSAMTIGTQSDYCNFLLQADTVIHGNPLLRHWYLTTISYYTTDVLYFSLGMAIRGFKPILIYEVPAAIYAIIVFLSVLLAANRSYRSRGTWFGAAAVTFALLAFPGPYLAGCVLAGTLHTGMMLPILVAFLAIDVPAIDVPAESGAVLPLWRVILFFAALTTATIADTMAIFIVIGPLLLVTLGEIRLETNPARRKSSLWIAGASLAAAPAAKISLAFIAAIGGFKMPDMYSNHASFIQFEDIAKNVGNTVESIQRLFGGEFWGQALGQGSLLAILQCSGAILVVWALVAAVWVWWRTAAAVPDNGVSTRDQPPIDRISAVLAVGMALNLVTYTLSNMQVGLLTARYLSPFFIMGAILVGRWLLSASKKPNTILAASGVFALCSLVTFFFQLRLPRVSLDSPPAHLGRWLQANGIAEAYGDYWSASATTVLSQKAALVAPVLNFGGKLAPCLCSVDERWYQVPVHCLVIGPLEVYGVTVKEAQHDLGVPDHIDTVEGYTIFTYKKDLTPLLGKSPFATP